MITYTIFVLTILFFLFIFFVLNKFIKIDRKKFLYREHKTFFDLFKLYRDASYFKVYREEIIVASSSGFSIRKDKENLKLAINKYITTIFEITGSTIIDDLIFLFGSREALISYLSLDFINRLNIDETEMGVNSITNLMDKYEEQSKG